MEENRTRRALDELADLFLTGPAGGPPPPADADEPATGPAEHEHAGTPAGDPRASSTPDPAAAPAHDFDPLAEFDLEGPAPIRLPPKTGPASAVELEPPGPARREAEPAERPSHLRLRRDEDARASGNEAAEPDDAGPTRLPEQARAHVEAVMLGNLPGLSGPWLTQYAQRLAQREGPVLLLHLDEQGVDLEMVEPTNRPQAPGRVPPRGRSGDLVDRLETLVRLSPNPVRRVLVHVEASPKPMVLARLRCLDTWTLLSGADDAASVAGQRLIQRMIETDPAATPRRIGVMMMGSDDETASRGIARLRGAASSFLEAPIELVGAQRQMVPVNVRQLGRFEPIQTLWPALRRWLAGLDPADVEAPQALRDEPVESAPMEDVDDAEPAVDARDAGEPADASVADREQAADAPDFAPATAPPPVEPEPARPRSSQAEPPPAEPKRPAPPQPEPARPEATEPTAAATPDLAAFLTQDSLTGGLALEARCPHQPDTQLLLDQNGRLHLLRRHHVASGMASPAQRSDADLPALRQALVELLEARAWVREHIDLLQLTQRQCRIDHQADPVLHLFTHRADLANALTARLGPMLKLHLLQKVGQGDHATWFSTPLN